MLPKILPHHRQVAEGQVVIDDVPHESKYQHGIDGHAEYGWPFLRQRLHDAEEEAGDGGIELSQVDVVGEDMGVSIDALTFGDLVKVSSSVPIEKRLMKKNVRVLVQPYYVDCNPATLKAGMPDTVFLSPVVFYGDENELTAERRMGFNLIRLSSRTLRPTQEDT